jgi:hypothetical protein
VVAVQIAGLARAAVPPGDGAQRAPAVGAHLSLIKRSLGLVTPPIGPSAIRVYRNFLEKITYWASERLN